MTRAKELERTAVALTDHGSISGWVQLDKACKENGIKPIFGCEVYMVDSIQRMLSEKDRKKNHLTLLAKNNTGYKNILSLVSSAYDNFYYFPTVDFNLLTKHSDGVIAFSGCWSGMLQRLLAENKIRDAEKLVEKYIGIFKDGFYLETQHYQLFTQTFDKLQILSKKYSIPIILTCDNHYLTDGQESIQEILHAVRDRREFDSTKIVKEEYQWEADKLFDLVESRFNLGDWKQIFSTVNDVAKDCNAELEKGNFPTFISDTGETSKAIMLRKCKEGINRLGLKNAGQVYKDRFKKELQVIESKGFIDYILIAADLIEWAKKNNILVGSGRGSSAGSLICYLLGITSLDPIKYDLLFERFIDETRTDPPDIDTDFDASRRDLVKEYAKEKYGEENVCDVATFAKFKGKNSLDEIGKMFQIPKAKIETVKGFLVERSGADMRNELTILDTFDMAPEAKQISIEYPDIMKACSLEGQLRHLGVHAAGVLISTRPLNEVLALYKKEDKTGEGKRVIASFEMKDSSALGLVKIDFLGLTELTILREVYESLGKDMMEIYDIPLDDVSTLDAFKNIDVQGIFQYEGDSTKSVLRQMPRVDFEQLIACLTLSKPGPAHCLHGNTKIYDCDAGEIIPISMAYKRKIKRTLSLFPDGSIRPQEIAEHLRFGGDSKTDKQKVYKLGLHNGRQIRATSEHWFLTDDGWKKLSELNIGDSVICTNKKIWNVGLTKETSEKVAEYAKKCSANSKGKHFSKSTEFSKGHAPWNKNVKWPEMSETRKQDWKDGKYKDNPKKFKKWAVKNKDIIKSRNTRASKIRAQQLARMSPKERRKELSNFIDAGSRNGYGKWGWAEDGHRVESNFELDFDNFLFKKGIEHKIHPRLKNYRKADYKIKGVYIECDGMDRKQEYWDEKYENGEPYIVLKQKDDWNDKLAFACEEIENHDWFSIGKSEVVSIEELGSGTVYDFKMKDVPNYLAEGIVVHNSGSATKYIAKMRGKEKVESFDWHPILADITSKTYGQLIYQEQIIRILREFANFSVTDANKCRILIAKSKGEQEFNRYFPKFEKGVGDKISADKTKHLWESIKVFGRYAFNRSHAASYALLGYWSMYMKTHYPAEFYVHNLNHEKEAEKKTRLLSDAVKHGFKVLPPLLGKSDVFWKKEGENGLRAGLTDVKGMGEKTAKLVIENKYSCREDFKNKKVKGITIRAYKALEENKCFEGDIPKDDYFDVHAYDVLDLLSPNRTKSEEIRDWDDSYNITVAGRFVEMNYKDIFEERKSRGQSADNIRNPEKAKYSMMLLEDETDRSLVHIDRFLFDKIGPDVWDAYNNKKIVIVEGQKVKGWRMIRAKRMQSFSREEINTIIEIKRPKKAVIEVEDINPAEDNQCIQNNLQKPCNGCDGCTLKGWAKVPGQVGTDNRIVFIGEAPGYDEVEQDKPFVGAAGKYLNELLKEAGLDRNSLYISNTCLCHPVDENGKNRRPTKEEIDCCNKRLLKSIEAINPNVIVSLGATALYALVRPQPLDEIKLGDYVGKELKSKNNYFVIPTYHPSFLLRKRADTEYRKATIGHIKKAMEYQTLTNNIIG